MSRGPKPAAQLYITRPNGTMLVQGVSNLDQIIPWIKRLAPHVSHDATWQVLSGDEHP